MPATLAELAAQFGCELEGDGAAVVDTVGTLADASGNAITFLANPHYRAQLKSTRAAAVILEPRYRDDCPVAALVCSNPYAVYARIAAFLEPLPLREPGIDATAVVSRDADIAETAFIGPNVVVGPGTRIGEGASIAAGTVLGASVSVGAGTRLQPHVVVMDRTVIGQRCVVQPGAVLGSDGFGFARDGGRWVPVPQLGRVLIGDDVHIGANTTIDRGAIGDTVIESGVILDNLIQIAHNVHIGTHTAMAAMTGVAGSTRVGARCLIGGAVVVVGHITICDDVMVTFHSTVLRSITEPGTYSSGFDADKASRWRRNAARFRRLDEQLKGRRDGGAD